MKKYQVKINEVEVEEIQNLGSNIGQNDDDRRRRIETYIRILRVAEAVIFLAIAVLGLLLEWPGFTLKLPSRKISQSEKP